AGLGDDAPLAEPRGEQDLAERIVDLVRAGVVQVLPLEDDAATGRREPLCLVERCGTTDVVRPQMLELLPEGGVAQRLVPAALELVERRDKRLRDVAPAAGTVRRLGHR